MDSYEPNSNPIKLKIVKSEAKDHVMEKVESMGSYSCPNCGKIFTNFVDFCIHLGYEHYEVTSNIRLGKINAVISCCLCKQEFTGPQIQFGALDEHNRIVHMKDDNFVCPDADCDVFYQSKDELYCHVEEKHNKSSSYTCLHCEKLFFSPHRLNKHLELTHQLKPFDNLTCLWCHKKFETARRATCHMRNEHSNSRILKCDVCHKEFDNKQALQTHQKNKHMGQKPRFTCHFCGKEYAHITQFKIHVECHMKKTKDVECDVCNKLFHSKFEINYHKKSLHVPKNFLFIQYDNLA